MDQEWLSYVDFKLHTVSFSSRLCSDFLFSFAPHFAFFLSFLAFPPVVVH